MSLGRLGLLAIVLAVSLALSSPPAQAYEYSYARVVRLSLVEGDVQIARPGTPEGQAWEQAVVNLPIEQGFTIATRNGRAEVEFESGAAARLAENSVLQFTDLALADGARITRLTLTQGTATFYADLAREDSFVVLTPALQISIPENARFRVDVYQDGDSVSVFKGNVNVDSQAGTHRLSKGHTLTYRPGDPEGVSIARNRTPDAWDRWVADRDEVVSSAYSASRRYVNSPYTYGMADLWYYGNWFPVSGYGLCWRPYGLGFNWSPFWNGRWIFYPGFGWTWVSFERWGWLPFHFGRWQFLPSLGWLWVPGFFHQWQPANVTWVRVGNRLGWVPLAPHDRPGTPPANLQHGVITTTTTGFIGAQPDAPNGFIGAKPYERVRLALDDKTEVVSAPPPPMRIVGRGERPTSVNPSSTGRAMILYDRQERRYVNIPRPADSPDDTPRRTGVRPPAGQAGTLQPSQTPPPQTPATSSPPRREMILRGGGRERPAAPPQAQPSRPASPARMQTPPPARVERPPVRNEAPRATPPPRMQPPPRPASPPPRMEAARPSTARPSSPPARPPAPRPPR